MYRVADPIQLAVSIANSDQTIWGTKILLISVNASTYGVSLALSTIFDSDGIPCILSIFLNQVQNCLRPWRFQSHWILITRHYFLIYYRKLMWNNVTSFCSTKANWNVHILHLYNSTSIVHIVNSKIFRKIWKFCATMNIFFENCGHLYLHM